MTGGQRERAEAELQSAAEALAAASMLLDAGLGRGCGQHTGQVTVFEATIGREPLLGRLLQLRVAADYGAAPLGTDTDLRALLDEAVVFVERCREHVGDEIAKRVDDPDPTPDL